MVLHELDELLRELAGDEEFNTTNGYRIEDELYEPIEYEGNTYTVELVDNFGGEGEGDTIWYTFSFKKNNELICFFRTIGYYDSWNGADWEGISIVTPKVEYSIDWVPADTDKKSLEGFEEYKKTENAPELEV